MARIKQNLFDYKQLWYIFIYILLLLIIDLSQIQNLYGENFIRRCIHMFNRRDYISYQKFLDPYAIGFKNIISQTEIDYLNSIETNQAKDFPWFSRKNTGTNMYANMNDNEKIILDETTEEVRKKCEKLLNQKLYNLPENNNRFYSYYGNNSHHLWHVDPENKKSIYNVIICVKRVGEISPFQYKDINNVEHTIHLNEGDGIFFRGGTTIHQVPPNNDENSFRKVLALSFTTDPTYNTKKSLCTFIEGGNKYINVLFLIAAMIIINYICSYIANVDKISYTLITFIVIVSLLLSRFMPIYFDIGLGTGRATSLFSNIQLYIIFIVLNFSLKRGALLLSYYILSDLLFPRSYVFYY
jgi:hypothetical protein